MRDKRARSAANFRTVAGIRKFPSRRFDAIGRISAGRTSFHSIERAGRAAGQSTRRSERDGRGFWRRIPTFPRSCRLSMHGLAALRDGRTGLRPSQPAADPILPRPAITA